MKTKNNLRIDYRFQNWGRMERIICEQDNIHSHVFLLFRQGQNVGAIYKEGGVWRSNSNTIFLPLDILRIGQFIEQHLNALPKSGKSHVSG